jgi:hypothetical protein
MIVSWMKARRPRVGKAHGSSDLRRGTPFASYEGVEVGDGYKGPFAEVDNRQIAVADHRVGEIRRNAEHRRGGVNADQTLFTDRQTAATGHSPTVSWLASGDGSLR